MTEAPPADEPTPFPKRAALLLEVFARGWSKGRVDLMKELFAENVVFIETPYSTPLNGIDALRTWLADIPYYQSEISFTVGEAFTAGDLWLSAEFHLKFRRRKTGRWVDARGALFAETDGTRITELRMYWHRRDTGD